MGLDCLGNGIGVSEEVEHSPDTPFFLSSRSCDDCDDGTRNWFDTAFSSMFYAHKTQINMNSGNYTIIIIYDDSIYWHQ